jgi:hypothetical protein
VLFKYIVHHDTDNNYRFTYLIRYCPSVVNEGSSEQMKSIWGFFELSNLKIICLNIHIYLSIPLCVGRHRYVS